MPTHASTAAGGVSATEHRRGGRTARSVLLGIAFVWFPVQAFPMTSVDPTTAQIELVQRLAIGFALVAAALIDWGSFHGLFGVD